MHRPCVPHHVRMDVLWDFRANILCHTSVFCKKCSYGELEKLHLTPYKDTFYMYPGSVITFWGLG